MMTDTNIDTSIENSGGGRVPVRTHSPLFVRFADKHLHDESTTHKPVGRVYVPLRRLLKNGGFS